MRRIALALALLSMAGCASAFDAPGCRGEVFDLNPPAAAPSPVATP
jgi:hypothetical protein